MRVARVLAASLLVCGGAALRHLSAIKDRLRAVRRRFLAARVRAANLSPICACADGAGARVSARGRVKVRGCSESLVGGAMSTRAESCIPRFFLLLFVSSRGSMVQLTSRELSRPGHGGALRGISEYRLNNRRVVCSVATWVLALVSAG